MQNMWISVALIVAVIIVGIIAGKRLSTPGPQRRAVYFAFGTLAIAPHYERRLNLPRFVEGFDESAVQIR